MENFKVYINKVFVILFIRIRISQNNFKNIYN